MTQKQIIFAILIIIYALICYLYDFRFSLAMILIVMQPLYKWVYAKLAIPREE